MNVMTNLLFVIGTVIAAMYLVPILITLIASGMLQFLLFILFVTCLVKLARQSKRRKFDDVDNDY